MSVGNDGFTDCTYVCNPVNGMAWSCGHYCPDYIFTTTPRTTLTTTGSAHQDTSEHSGISKHPGITENEEELASYWIVCLCTGVLLVALLVIICFFCKQKIRAFIPKRHNRGQRAHAQTVPSEEEAENGTRSFIPEAMTLLPVRSQNSIENNATTVFPSSSFDSGVSVSGATLHVANEVGNSLDTTLNDGKNEKFGIVRSIFPSSNNRHQDSMPKSVIEGTAESSNSETIPKEIDELACLAIGQNLSCARNIMVVNPTANITATEITGNEVREHVADNGLGRDDVSVENIDVSVSIGNRDNGESDIPNADDSDDQDEEAGDEEQPGDEDEDDDVDDDDDDDDDDDEDENGASAASDKDIARNERLLNHYTNRKEKSNRNGIVRVVTEIKFREL